MADCQLTRLRDVEGPTMTPRILMLPIFYIWWKKRCHPAVCWWCCPNWKFIWSHQPLCHQTDKFLKWSEIEVKVAKCRTMAYHSKLKIKLTREIVLFVENSETWFLNEHISFGYNYQGDSSFQTTVLSRIKAEAYFRTSRVCQQASIQVRLLFRSGFNSRQASMQRQFCHCFSTPLVWQSNLTGTHYWTERCTVLQNTTTATVKARAKQQ